MAGYHQWPRVYNVSILCFFLVVLCGSIKGQCLGVAGVETDHDGDNAIPIDTGADGPPFQVRQKKDGNRHNFFGVVMPSQ